MVALHTPPRAPGHNKTASSSSDVQVLYIELRKCALQCTLCMHCLRDVYNARNSKEQSRSLVGTPLALLVYRVFQGEMALVVERCCLRGLVDGFFISIRTVSL